MSFHFSPVNSTRSSTNISRGSTQEVSDGREDLYETQMNPDYSSPARSKWIDAVNRVRQKLDEVSYRYLLLTISGTDEFWVRCKQSNFVI